jgi:hypothetical protein
MKECPTADVCAELLKKMRETHKELRASIEAVNFDEVNVDLDVDISEEIKALTELARKRIEIKL